jgi:NAD-dependent dihydropyrimidine dehydrogenase PreA subunit
MSAGRDTDGLFIAVEVDDAVAHDPELVAKLAEVCPVDIFAQDEDGGLRIVAANLDECVLCRLCIDAAPPGTVRVIKRYDDGPDAVLSSAPESAPQ